MNTAGICKTVASTRSYLQTKTTGELCGLLRLQTLISAMQMAANNPIVEELNSNFKAAVYCPGQVFCGDEKLVCFTGHHKFVRQMKSKPSQMGIWFYQEVMILGSGRPFLMTTKAHFVPDEAKTTLKTAHIINQ